MNHNMGMMTAPGTAGIASGLGQDAHPKMHKSLFGRGGDDTAASHLQTGKTTTTHTTATTAKTKTMAELKEEGDWREEFELD